MAVGSPSSSSGSVQVLAYNDTVNGWIQIGQALRGDSGFGGTVSLSMDGFILACSAWDNASIASYVRVFEYDPSSNQWDQRGSDLIR